MAALLKLKDTHVLGRVLTVTIAVLTLALPRTSQAYCRTTTKDIPADYNPMAKGCFTEGLPLFWRGACIGYSVNSQASTRVSFVAATRIIDEAFATWNAITCGEAHGAFGISAQNVGPVTCSEVRYNKTRPNQNVLVFRDKGWNSADSANTLGLTTVSYDVFTGEIYDADIELNSTDKNLTTSNSVPTNGYDLLSIVTHEAGHFLGLAHAADPSATMFASYRPGSDELRTLTADDVSGVCAIYPSTMERRVDTSVSPGGTMTAKACDFTARHGFSTECEAPPINEAPPPEEDGPCAMHPGSAAGSARGGFLVLGAILIWSRRRQRRPTSRAK